MTALTKYYVYLSSMITYVQQDVQEAIQEEDGQSLAEYGLILALIAVVAIAALQLMGTQINAALGKITDELGK